MLYLIKHNTVTNYETNKKKYKYHHQTNILINVPFITNKFICKQVGLI